jgi:membrane protease subunit HflC
MPYPKLMLPLVLLFFLGWSCAFTVDQREYAMLLRFGEIKSSDYTPGLHFKVPFIDTVRKFDARLMSLDAEPERFLTSEKKDVIVDSFVKWRITDPKVYYRRTGGDVRRAGLLLFQTINDGLRGEFGRRTVQEVIAGLRGDVMKIVTQGAAAQGKELGVEVVDVRIKRIDLPDEVSSAVYGRMRAERERVARDFRSRGEEAAERIQAKADRERVEILSEAYREAEQVRGVGDAQAAEIYAKAYGNNPEFYAFTRSLGAYQRSFGSRNDVLLIEPDSEFFNYFKKPGGSR